MRAGCLLAALPCVLHYINLIRAIEKVNESFPSRNSQQLNSAYIAFSKALAVAAFASAADDGHHA